jgi:lipopolysaccharide transport system permease protein
VLPTLTTTLIWVYLNSAHVFNVAHTDIPYPAYVLVGTVLWQAFVDALNSPLQQLSSAQHMLTKINFPREALLLVGWGEVLFNLGVRLVFLLLVLLALRITIPATVILAPLGFLTLLALGGGLGLLLAPLGALYPDVQKGLGIFTSLWFFVTPVVYPLPTTGPGALLVALNPVTPLLVTTRELVTTGVVSQAGHFWLVCGLMPILLLAAWVLLRLALPHLIERLAVR